MSLATFVAVVGACASLQGVAAETSWSTDEALAGRVDSRMIGNQCHPGGTWTFGGQRTIPPCISEQIISRTCESATLGNKDNLRACLFGQGSSYEQDLLGCLECKRVYHHHSPAEDRFWRKKWTQGIQAYKTAEPLTQGLWDFVSQSIDWSQYPQEPKGTSEKEYFPVEEYYHRNASIPQNHGAWTASAKLRARGNQDIAGASQLDVKYFFNDQGEITSISTTSEGITA